MAVIFLPAAIILIYLPWLFVGGQEKLTGYELGQVHPRFFWVGWIFPVMNFAVGIGMFFLILPFWRGSSAASTVSFVMIIIAIAVFNGLFNLATGVCPVPMSRVYRYVYLDQNRTVGAVQIILGSFFILLFYLSG
ncbi:MAG: hypothetical protein QNJ45_13655 [Ardenticatenaceae bacterium]|nr:hypothetical protein [Ardenticatenaceae bacterium]